MCVCVCFLFYIRGRRPARAALVVTVVGDRLCPSPGVGYGNIRIEAGP